MFSEVLKGLIPTICLDKLSDKFPSFFFSFENGDEFTSVEINVSVVSNLQKYVKIFSNYILVESGKGTVNR